jgi:hypothetical protein
MNNSQKRARAAGADDADHGGAMMVIMRTDHDDVSHARCRRQDAASVEMMMTVSVDSSYYY